MFQNSIFCPKNSLLESKSGFLEWNKLQNPDFWDKKWTFSPSVYWTKVPRFINHSNVPIVMANSMVCKDKILTWKSCPYYEFCLREVGNVLTTALLESCFMQHGRVISCLLSNYTVAKQARNKKNNNQNLDHVVKMRVIIL